MRYQELVTLGKKKLKQNNIKETLVDYLMEEYIGLNIICEFNNLIIDKSLELKFLNAIESLINKKPIQYIIGFINFYGYKFKISKDVLIPRFETEELVSNTIYYINKYLNSSVRIADIGTGSGVIGITLKKELPNSIVTLTDISKKALNIAKNNALRLGVDVNFLQGNMLKPIILQNEKYDVIISNPPYIKNKEEIMSIVKNNEPQIALYGGEDGMRYYYLLLKEANVVLKNKSIIALEINPILVKKLVIILKKFFKNSKYIIKKDLQKRKRMLFIFNNINIYE